MLEDAHHRFINVPAVMTDEQVLETR